MSYKLNYTTEEKIKLAKDNSIDQIYESKKNQRAVRVITVFAYLFSVSLAAIILSLYFTLIWKPKDTNQIAAARIPQCEKIVIPEITAENIAIKMSNGSELTLDVYYEALRKYLKEEKALMALLKAPARATQHDFNEHLSRIPAPSMLRSRKGMKKWNKGRNKNSDDEDDNIEESGDKEITVSTQYSTSQPDNDTTIVFDQEID